MYINTGTVFLQLLYIFGVYWAGPVIASAFQVHTDIHIVYMTLQQWSCDPPAVLM